MDDGKEGRRNVLGLVGVFAESSLYANLVLDSLIRDGQGGGLPLDTRLCLFSLLSVKALLLICALVVAGCGGPPRVVYYANTIPQGAFVDLTMDASGRDTEYHHFISKGERERGVIQIPTLVFHKPGFEPYVHTPASIRWDEKFEKQLVSETWAVGQLYYTSNSVPVALKKFEAYDGSASSNFVVLTINSEPLGARIYSGGTLVGVAPVQVKLPIPPSAYQTRVLVPPPFSAAKDGWIPERQELKLLVEESWKFEIQKSFQFSTVFLLKTDPNQSEETRRGVSLRSPGSSESTENPFDFVEQLGRISVMIKTLQALP